MPRALKVFRTPIGFHDAYVAAPTKKAALEAWGSDANLFARGVAEEVTDPALMAAPLAQPGVVIRTLRGTAAEQLAALPPDKPKPRKSPPGPAAAKPAPRPSRAKLDAAEAALAEAEATLAAEKRRLDQQAAEIARQRTALDRRGAKEVAALTDERDREEAAYRKAVRAWNPDA